MNLHEKITAKGDLFAPIMKIKKEIGDNKMSQYFLRVKIKKIQNKLMDGLASHIVEHEQEYKDLAANHNPFHLLSGDQNKEIDRWVKAVTYNPFVD